MQKLSDGLEKLDTQMRRQQASKVLCAGVAAALQAPTANKLQGLLPLPEGVSLFGLA